MLLLSIAGEGINGERQVKLREEHEAKTEIKMGETLSQVADTDSTV